MSNTFDDLNFLMSSENRIEVLKAIAEGPKTAEELVRSTATSRITVDRILDDFFERRWIDDRDDVYRPTILGSAVAEDTVNLEQMVAIAQQFRPVGEFFTPDELDFDPRLFRDATMTRSPSDSTFDHIDRWITICRNCDHFRGFTSNVPAALIDVFVEEMRDNGLKLEGIFTGELADAMMGDPEKHQVFGELLELGADMYRYDDAKWDFTVGMYDDDRMSIAGLDDVGAPRVKIESDSPALREWAEAKFLSYREHSVPITLE